MSLAQSVGQVRFVGPVRLDGLSDGVPRLTAAAISALTSVWKQAADPVLISLGRTDLRALRGHLSTAPLAAAVAGFCAQSETGGAPAFAILDGTIAGDALVMALAAQGRIASARCRLVFDQVRVGALPAQGTACRLTRLVGAEQALRILSGGLILSATEALAMGLVDYVVETETRPLGAASEAHAAEMLAAGTALSATRREKALRDGRGHLAAVAAFRAEAFGDPAYQKCLADCVEACLLLPGEQALFYEASRCEILETRPEGRALRHLLAAEDAVQIWPEALRSTPTVAISTLGIWGTIPLHTGPILLNALSRDLGVVLADSDQMRLVAQLKEVAARQELSVQQGRMAAAKREAEWSRLTPSLDPEDLAHLPLVLIGPDAEVPAILRPGPHLAEGEMRTVLVMGRQTLPEGAYRLVQNRRVSELALPPGAGAQTAAQAMAFLRQMGMIVIMTGTQAPAGIAGRLAGAGTTAVRSLIAMGVAPEAIADAMAEAGLPSPRLGDPVPGVPPLNLPAREIVARWMSALANEGVRQLAAGLARSTGDIDLVAVHGLGVPRHLGGPMHWADAKGPLILRRDLTKWAADAAVWAPHPGWDAFVSLGKVRAGAVVEPA